MEPKKHCRVSTIRYCDIDDGRVILEQKCPFDGIRLLERVIIENGYVWDVGPLEVTALQPDVMFSHCRKVGIAP